MTKCLKGKYKKIHTNMDNKKDATKNKGITLIALVITIIILLILASISIAMLTGENGLLKQAQRAKTETEEKGSEEIEKLNELSANIDRKSVYEVIVGEDTIKIPLGFYYVGGTVDSGIVISDNENDRNKYKGEEDVPSGVEYNEDGTIDKEKSELKGNQFVWIPCDIENYKKKDFGISNTTGWTDYISEEEKEQIEEYNGFYVGRYEAGTSELILKDGASFSETSKWRNTNLTSKYVESGKITTKAGEIPYYHANYATAVEMAENMYDTASVKSKLMTGALWDVMIDFLSEDKEVYSDVKNTSWGNYNNTVLNKCQGRYLNINHPEGKSINDATVEEPINASDVNGKIHYGILTTASTEEVKRKNLYDIAGNLWEWSTETATGNNINYTYYNVRGGSWLDSGTQNGACARGSGESTDDGAHMGFRPILYIK